MNAVDELSFLRKSAARVGVDIDADPMPVSRERIQTSAGALSWLRWGEGAPTTVTVHGGGQNAHTWDSFVYALDRPIISVDLPGHGHSAWRPDRNYLAQTNALTLAEAFDARGMSGLDYIGMSLGGLSGIALAAARPDLVRRLVIVDVTPGVRETYSTLDKIERGSTTLFEGPRTFASLDEMMDVAVAASPGRTRESLEAGTYFNARQHDDGTWSWRYDVTRGGDEREHYDRLWDALSQIEASILLVRGGRSRFISDEDAARFVEVQPSARVVTVADAGHSVQGDQPAELARVVGEFLTEGR